MFLVSCSTHALYQCFAKIFLKTQIFLCAAQVWVPLGEEDTRHLHLPQTQQQGRTPNLEVNRIPELNRTLGRQTGNSIAPTGASSSQDGMVCRLGTDPDPNSLQSVVSSATLANCWCMLLFFKGEAVCAPTTQCSYPHIEVCTWPHHHSILVPPATTQHTASPAYS